MHRLSFVLLVAACAGHRGAAESSFRDPLVEETWSPPAAQECQIIPPFVSSLDALLDSTRLAAALPPTADAGHVVWTLAFDTAGAPVHMRALESTLAELTAAAYQDTIWSLLRPQARSTRVRLRLDATPGSLTFRIGGTHYCAPLLQNVDEVRRAMGALGRSGRAVVALVIRPDGSVESHQLVETSGNETTDRMALGLVSGLRYHPA